MNTKDIIEYIKANGVSNEDWDLMYKAAVEYDDNKNEEQKHKELIEDVRTLENLYKKDKHFQKWCKSILDIEEYETAFEEFERKYALSHGGESHPEYADAPGEYYIIPCFDFCNREGNPYLRHAFRPDLAYYVREDIDNLITGSESGEECFAVWWHGKFGTLHTPEFYIYKDRVSPECPTYIPTSDNKKGLNWYTRTLRFDLTIWGKKYLKETYAEAMQGKS